MVQPALPPGEHPQRQLSPEDLKIVEDVTEGLEKRSTVIYNQSTRVMRVVFQNPTHPQIIEFWNTQVLRMETILLEQNPSKIGIPEKNCVEETTELIVRSLFLFPSLRIDLFSKLFDTGNVYYKGSRSNYMSYPGDPEFRCKLLRIFADLKGFEQIRAELCPTGSAWQGAMFNLKLVEAMRDSGKHIPVSVCSGIQRHIMDQMIALTEEQLKKDSTETISHLMSAIQAKKNSDLLTEQLQQFWLSHTQKLMSSSSIVLKLFAWDQMSEIIKEASLTKPHPLVYIVRGAGNPVVNGTYQAKFRVGDVPLYTKPGDPTITLFRCTMRSKQKWWFLSHADAEKPGTDKDIDYYQHKSYGEDEEREPPLSNWNSVLPNGENPAPSFEARDYFIPEGMSYESYLISKVTKWVETGNVLSFVFGAAMHRELVLRSKKLLLFLADENALTADHIKMIWSATLACNDIEITDEILSLLSALSLHMNNSTFIALMDVLGVAVRADEHGKDSQFAKVVSFVEKFFKESSKHLYKLSSANGTLLLNFMWSLYRHPLIETSKIQGITEDLLSRCLYQNWTPGAVVAFVKECADALQSVSVSREHESVDEMKISRALQSLSFILSQESSRRADADLSGYKFGDVLQNELSRFVKSNRSKALSGKGDIAWYKDSIAKRLHSIRVYYGIQFSVNMDQAQINTLWELLSESCERDELFTFFKEGGLRVENIIEAAYLIPEFVYVFKNMICNRSVDWSKSSEGMFHCFTTYYSCMANQTALRRLFYDDISTIELCKETIWNIIIMAPLNSVAEKAIPYLIKCHQLNLHDMDSGDGLLEKIFNTLMDIDLKCKERVSGSDKLLTGADIQKISRCVSILNMAISDLNTTTIPSHISRSCMNRIHVTAACRINPAPTYDHLQRLITKKATEISVNFEIHPMSTIHALKLKLCSYIPDARPNKLIIYLASQYLSDDSVQISDAGFTDNSEFSVVVSQSSAYDSKHDEYDDSAHNVGVVVSKRQRFFDILFSLSDTLSSTESIDVGVSAIAQSIWKILMVIPTQPNLQRAVEECSFQVPPTSSSEWVSLLNPSSISRCAYVLQIIDSFIQPAIELSDKTFIPEKFIASGGFDEVLRVFLSASENSGANTELRKVSLSVALHTIHFCLFGADKTNPPAALLDRVHSAAASMVHTLLGVANYAAEGGHTGSVQDSLNILTYLLRSPDIATQITSNHKSKALLTSVLRHKSERVRGMATDFANQIGKTQKIVFNWLLEEVDGMTAADKNCSEIFSAFGQLLIAQKATLSRGPELAALANCLSSKIINYPRGQVVNGDPIVLMGCLNLLKSLIESDIEAIDSTDLGKNLVNIFLCEFLFAMPTQEVDVRSVCNRPQSRKAAFSALVAYLSARPQYLTEVMSQLGNLQERAAPQLRFQWFQSSFVDNRRNQRTGYTGLKNQGCTCYSNSLLQQLFMNVPFRNAVLSTPLRASHRSSLWHLSDEELIGKDVLIEWDGGIWKAAQVTARVGIGMYNVQYKNLKGQVEDSLQFQVRGGYTRPKKETGRVRLNIPAIPGSEKFQPNEKEDAANRILEQLQRTFCYLLHSKQPYFDPKQLIEACKTLNLNYNVYHQNDASEFCDQLLDRLETAMKGKFTGINVWKQEMMTNVFGGQMLYQKIPQECEFFEADKGSCGHWQSTREESFLKAELIIRGKDNIEDSLSQLVAGELMNGDNQIMCEKCNQKKDTTRRTCFDTLPNMLIIHLKRFDLDFTTFETVKLNNRIAFPTTLSMYKYTKEGMEADEKARILAEDGSPLPPAQNPALPNLVRSTSGGGVGQSVDPNAMTAEAVKEDLSDYDYELQGVLVHAGVAQGGHYYSFIRDISAADGVSKSEDIEKDKWYRFDDEDVSNFDPEHIPTSCFGGTVTTNIQGVHEAIEEDRSSNALMLFFRKIKPKTVKATVSDAVASGAAGGAGGTLTDGPSSPLEIGAQDLSELAAIDPLIDGFHAFEREVWESNMKNLLSEYVLDGDLHVFVRDLLKANCLSSEKASVGLEKAKEFSAFGLHFFLEIVLHCRDKSGLKIWLEAFHDLFMKQPSTAELFLSQIVAQDKCFWLKEFLLFSIDNVASSSFVQLIFYAVRSLINVGALQKIQDVAKCIIDLLRLVPSNPKNAEEIFVAIRDLSTLPELAECFLESDVVARLAYFISPESCPSPILAWFDRTGAVSPAQVSPVLIAPAFEAIASILGLPQTRKASLVEEDPVTMQSDLTPKAKEVLISIFNDSAHIPGKFEFRDLTLYLEKVQSANVKNSHVVARNILDRFGDRTYYNNMYLEGFLLYQFQRALNSPKLVWKDIHAFGFQNDLSKAATVSSTGAASVYSEMSDRIMKSLRPASVECLSKLGFYEAGLSEAESAVVTVAKRICFGNRDISVLFLHQCLDRLNHKIVDMYQNEIEIAANFIRTLAVLDDGLMDIRLREIVLSENGYLCRYLNETKRAQGHRNGVYTVSDYRFYAETYLRLFKTLSVATDAVASWFESNVFVDPKIAHLKPGYIPERGLIRDDIFRNKFVAIDGAGVHEVNGRYNYDRINDDAAMFRKDPVMYYGKSVSFCLFRCKMQSGEHCWFISYNAENPLIMGNSYDVDFYSALNPGYNDDAETLPPTSNWRVVGQGRLQAPIITIYDSVEGEVDDREDSTGADMDDGSSDSDLYGNQSHYNVNESDDVLN